MADFKPMLAAKAKLEKIQFPIICQPKYDGIRGVGVMDGVLSRTLKPIPNLYLQSKMQYLNELLPGGISGLDGEFVSYTHGKADSLYTVQSKVMAVNGKFDFKFHIFDDYHNKNVPYAGRHRMLNKKLITVLSDISIDFVDLSPCNMIFNMEDLLAYEESLVSDGWEGMIGRKPDGFYKYGRATANEGLLLKFKQFEDDEAIIIGYEELDHNENEAFLDERGQTKRSSHKENKVAGGVLGALLLDWNGIQFKVGTGFDADQRTHIWNNSEEFMGRSVTFKYKGTGPNGKPLIASFKAFRDDLPSKEVPPPKSDDNSQGGFAF